ncbi:hypothetical protein [Acinetobacter sp.]|uniref:hypothetical protein n=1 Tax=Acinetobacter sp. TaxID=472 RepID=UPI003D02714F
MKALSDLLNIPEPLPETVSEKSLPTLLNRFNSEVIPYVRTLNHLLKELCELYNLEISKQSTISRLVGKIFTKLISSSHKSDIDINVAGLYYSTLSTHKLAVYPAGFAMIDKRTYKVSGLYKYHDTSIAYEDIFYNKKDEVSAWLRTLNNRNKAVYNMHILFCDALQPFYDVISAARGANTTPEDEKRSMHLDFKKSMDVTFWPQWTQVFSENEQIDGYDVVIEDDGRFRIKVNGSYGNIDMSKDIGTMLFMAEDLPYIVQRTKELVTERQAERKALIDAFTIFEDAITPYKVSSDL